jgi:hypothetical protein
MKILKVPYAEKDQAKALGARWNNERKTWYVPDGQPSAPFEQWLSGAQDAAGAGAATPAKVKVDSYSSAPVTGANYFALEHDCSPFIACAQCAPVLDKAGWTAAHAASNKLLRAL